MFVARGSSGTHTHKREMNSNPSPFHIRVPTGAHVFDTKETYYVRMDHAGVALVVKSRDTVHADAVVAHLGERDARRIASLLRQGNRLSIHGPIYTHAGDPCITLEVVDETEIDAMCSIARELYTT